MPENNDYSDWEFLSLKDGELRVRCGDKGEFVAREIRREEPTA